MTMNDRARRWVRRRDGALWPRPLGPQRYIITVVEDDIILRLNGRLVKITSPDDARWLGTRLIEAAALAEAETGISPAEGEEG